MWYKVIIKVGFICLMICLIKVDGLKEKISRRKYRSNGHQNGISSSSKEEYSSLQIPWVNLSMKMPTKEGMPDKIDEINLELRFDDDTPPSKMTVLDPNITWTGDEHHHLSILEPVITGIHLKDNVTRGAIDVHTKWDPTGGKCECTNIDAIVDQLIKKDLIIRGEKGDSGTNGLPGLSIQGPKGEPGESAPIPYHLQSLDPTNLNNLKGDRGPPGYCSPRDCEWRGSGLLPTPPTTAGRPGTGSARNAGAKPQGPPPQELYKIVPGALVFPTRRGMLQMQQFSFIGTVAFVESDETFYGRVKNGWRAFTMGSRVHRVVLSTPNYQEEELRQRPDEAIQNYGLNCSSAGAPGRGKGPILCMSSRTPTTKVSPQWLKMLTHPQRNPSNHDENGDNVPLISDKTLIMPTRLIALNSPLSGNMGGLNQVNYQCQRQSMRNNLHGIFRALLNLNDVTNDPDTVLVNLKNDTLLSLSDDGSTENWQIYSFNGRDVSAHAKPSGKFSIWGTPNPKDGFDRKDCRSWTSNAAEDEGFVANISDLKDRRESIVKADSCEKRHVVICYEFLHMSQVNVRHRNKNSNRVRLSFDKYLAILKSYDDNLKLQKSVS